MFINDWLYERKMKKQRAKRKYSDDMCWDLQYTLLQILPQMIETLRKAKHGYPAQLNFEEINNFPIKWVQEELSNLKEEYKEKDFDEPDIQDSFTRWQLTLKRISYCLKQADETQTNIFNPYEEEYNKQRWGQFKNFKDSTEVYKHDNKGKPLLYKFKDVKIDSKLKENYFNKLDEIDKYRDDMKTEAFNLINKYFWNLWD